MDMPDESGSTRRQHLMQALESAPEGSAIYEDALAQLDDAPEIPFYIVHIWEWFWQINKGRSAGMSGPNPITWQDIVNWNKLLNKQIRPIEVEILYEIDSVYLKKNAERAKKKKPNRKGGK